MSTASKWWDVGLFATQVDDTMHVVQYAPLGTSRV